MTSFEAICAAGVATSLIYQWIAHRAFARWASQPEPPAGSDAAREPITFFRPLKSGVSDLRGKLEAMALALRGEDQLLLGAAPGSDEARVCEEVRAAFPALAIEVVLCAETGEARALNPKVAKLLQMSPRARHERWVIADSEARLDAEWIAAWRAEWTASGADVLTAGYRIEGARTWPERLDAAALLVTLWLGVTVLHSADAICFTLGACVGLKRGDLERLGGWAAFGDVLAEDNRLGAALAADGRKIGLSQQVVPLASDSLTWREWWQHQRRVAFTYRISNPWGYAGSIVTQGEMWALALLACRNWLGGVLFLAMWGSRALVATRMARRLGFSLRGLPLAVLGASVAGSVCWGLSWLSRTVWWGGRRWRVNLAGRLTGI